MKTTITVLLTALALSASSFTVEEPIKDTIRFDGIELVGWKRLPLGERSWYLVSPSNDSSALMIRTVDKEISYFITILETREVYHGVH